MAPRGDVWLVLSDPFPTRVFFDCGIVDGLYERLGERLRPVLLLEGEEAADWQGRLEGMAALPRAELFPWRVPTGERMRRRADRWVDDHAGFYPLAVRHSLRHGFHPGRWRPGHDNWFLDPERAGRLPRWRSVERAMMRWHFSDRRYVPSALSARMRGRASLVVVSNLQARSSMPFLTAASRLGVPVAGHVASWDHTVGKGVVSPRLERYVVQNATMREDLARYHGIPEERIVVTGWPQTDLFAERRPRSAYEALLGRLGLDPARPVVLYAGNTPTNSPYEGNLVRRLVDTWRRTGAAGRYSLLFRPHPRDRLAGERFAAAAEVEGAAVQDASYTDLEDLAVLLQHVDCVAANAGTILLEAIVNDRPAVCVLFDEGAPPGERWAELNLGGAHYQALAGSGAFYRAGDLDELMDGIERAVASPAGLSAERGHVAFDVVGEVDGRAGERVVEALLGAAG